jgi:shikimate dehydrogenase
MASSGDGRRAAVLGSPISHSLSPAMHRAAYAELGLANWTYEAIEVDGPGLTELVNGCGPEWVGFSVTMPGKAAAAAVADSVSDRVKRLGVANTLVQRSDSWFAENTDVDGVIGALRAAGAPPVRRALLVGGGGSALATLAGLAEMGLESVTVAGRQESSTAGALALAIDLGLDAMHCGVDLAAIGAAADGVDLVVATVPAGAADHLAGVLARVPVLFDAIYHPWPTPLAAAGGPDRITVTGLDMLLHQAFRQVELMTGQPAPAAVMRDALRTAAGVDLPLPLLA